MADTETIPPRAAEVLEFWFGGAVENPALVTEASRRWFLASRDEDAEIVTRFAALLERAAKGELDDWARTPRGALALIIVLDQFSRNVHRGSATAFANDARALQLCQDGLARGQDAALAPVERAFFCMPLQHAEDIGTQRQSVECVEQLFEDASAELRPHLEDFVRFAKLHRDIIARFGRFPHRNHVLGRTATPQEEAYLADGGQRFGQ